MNKQNQYDKKRKFLQQKTDDNDDEQIEKTLNFFDSMLNEYLYDQNITDENKIEKSYSQMKSTNNIGNRQNSHGVKSAQTTTYQDPVHTQAYYSNQFENIHPHHFEQITSNDYINNVRRHTSETNLNQINSLIKPITREKISRQQILQTTATSTDDLLIKSSSKNVPRHERLSVLIDKTNYLTANNTSASLIDLTSIDKLSSRPRFRFVPPSNQNLTFKDEHNIEQQTNQNYDQYHLKTIPQEQILFNNQNKSSHKIVKPIVIIPSTPKSAPINHLTETNIHHEHGKSAFKPHRSNKNDIISKIQSTSPILNKKRIESIHQSNLHVGITNPNNQISDINLSNRQKQSTSNNHHLSSKNIPEKVNRTILTSDQSTSSDFIKTQSNKLNGHHHHPYQLPSSFGNSVSKWIQQVHNNSSINGLVHSSYNRPFINGGENRSQQQVYPYGSYMSTHSGISQPMNGFDHVHHQHTYPNSVNVHKYISPQHSVPIQSTHLPSSSVPRNGIFSPPSSNVYNFNQSNVSREGQSKRNSHRQNVTGTSYL
ncbi:unnamed protein product [Rotaria sordida]|uniref:Uncharacterized protein n=2 Tax=Rotaria sordida TaxID=392033 RepID=A0A818W749_9BILA|nr:unnamed protein product [Rotaria sordida]CAF3721279.1 unnamed protein product [Rotaria sordida]